LAKRVALCISNDFSADRRVEKTANSLIEMGWEPLVIGRKLQPKKNYPKKKFRVARLNLLFKSGPLFYAELNFRLFFKLIFTRLDAIHSNDLDTLLACYLASWFKRKHLIYDSHEFFTEVPELLSNPFARNLWLSIEQRIFPLLKHVTTVNQSIANEYELRYGIRPKVVRNIANAPVGREALPVDKPDRPFIVIMQGAGINIDRGAEELLEAFTLLPDYIRLKIIGKGDVFATLKKMRVELKLENQVDIIDSLPYAELMKHTAESHLGATLDKATNPNYALSLPNKIFDYMRAGLPIISSSVVEVANIVNTHKCGTVLTEVEPKNIAEAILYYANNIENYWKTKIKVETAAKAYSWENEFNVFKEIYSNFK
tara:strand:+ start:49394 stop:50506 length:1113 start_codon:yes stop_codon:yes gene_type:complete